MDLIDAFFDFNRPVKKVQCSGPQVGGTMLTADVSDDDEREEFEGTLGTDYVKEIQERDVEECLEIASNNPINQNTSNHGAMSEMEELTSLGANTQLLENLNAMDINDPYSNYNFTYRSKENLPITSLKSRIVSMIETNQAVIIQGQTGCGKTTQVPQFILDSYAAKKKPCKIIVTQPRRIAAISIAKRVAEQRGWPLGEVVGYQVGLDKKCTESSLLTYVTTGVLLQKLVTTKHLNDYTHIILDEVHERDKDMDFVLLTVRKFMRTNSRTVKVILMSATINVQQFSDYFSVPSGNVLESAPVIDVDKMNRHEVLKYYLDQLGQLGPLPAICISKPTIDPLTYKICTALIKHLDVIDERGDFPGSVLIFLPGIFEIEELDSQLRKEENKSKKNQYEIIPLHSTITWMEQKKIFISPQRGVRKIILSTNIAESSITVADVKYVIDFCLTKQLIHDPMVGLSSLQLMWASHTNCDQRGGRTGRVADGRVYRFVPLEFYENCLPAEGIPELLRSPLDRLVLMAKKLELGAPHEVLALAMNPPDLTNITRTILLLKEMGALTRKYNNKYDIYDGHMTFLGHIMAALPVDVHVSKMIVLGYIFGVLNECIIMGAGMSVKNVFSTPFKEAMKAYSSKLAWADGSCSDLIAILNVYQVYRHNESEGLFSSRVGGGFVGWANRQFLQHRVLAEMHELVLEIRGRLKQMKIDEVLLTDGIRWNNMEKPLILKIVICGAFYPYYYIRMPDQVSEQEAVKLLDGRDPYTTVYLQGLDPAQPGDLYARSIKESLRTCSKNMVLSFDSSYKVYVQFIQKQVKEPKPNELVNKIPGKVALDVYRAVKFRKIGQPVIVHLLEIGEAKRRAEKLNIAQEKEIVAPKKWKIPKLPGLEVTTLHIEITHIIDPGHFWAIEPYSSESTIKILFSELKRVKKGSSPIPEKVKISELYAAPFEGFYYRARVDAIIPNRDGSNNVQVFFIDYGNYQEVPQSDILVLPNVLLDLPGLAFECVLCEVQPSVLLNSRSLWSDKAKKLFETATRGEVLMAKIYSVVQGIISVELYKNRCIPKYQEYMTEDGLNINQMLIGEKFAKVATESFLSNHNHELRASQLNLECSQRKVYNDQQLKWSNANLSDATQDVESPRREECKKSIALKGPFSPLEMTVHNMAVLGGPNTINIDGESINSALLDSEPQDPHERMLVAASVGQNAAKDRLHLRYTTIMPSIGGFPAFMSLLFCPTAELRTDLSKTRYVSALCGLGHKDKKPLFREHDILVNIDVHMDSDDILLINSIRFHISAALIIDEGMDHIANPPNVAGCQQKIQEMLLELISKQRKSHAAYHVERAKNWGLIDPKDMLCPETTVVDYSDVIYPWHTPPVLRDGEVEHEDMKPHLLELLQFSQRLQPFPDDGLNCQVCNTHHWNIDSLRVHLITQEHKRNCEELDIDMSDLED